uniref:S-acyltransferase n=1 Tax=Kalanchoe fedtschenkoi TaxID=63787 RepID=A0A7N0UK03_KALFE
MSRSQEHSVNIEDNESTCWGCGLRVLLPSSAPVFKCGWCGAITNRNAHKHGTQGVWWRHIRDRIFVGVLLGFMIFFICGGVWAVYPIVFSISFQCGTFHSVVTAILALCTISSFSLAAFRAAGSPPAIPWGSFQLVGKGGLENYTYCYYCEKPKSTRAHHCRSCGICILDMDHHCPFIGNCVGASNHRYFICFLISTVLSTIYVSVMTAYAGLQIWPPMALKSLGTLDGTSSVLALQVLKEIMFGLLRSAAHLSLRGVILFYLFMASLSVSIGLVVLLWQQLCYIYKGKTYLSNLNSTESSDVEEKNCNNLLRFFGCPHLASKYFPYFLNSRKIHDK